MSWTLTEQDGDEWLLLDGHTEWEEAGVQFRPSKHNGQDVSATLIAVWLPYSEIKRMMESL